MQQHLQRIEQQHRAAVEGMFRQCAKEIEATAELAIACLEQGGKLIFCGNGGSACDAMHIAGEFVGRFVSDRRALPALALSADTGILTAVANDYAYDQVFSRQIEALGQPVDVLIALSTSGSSANVLRALASAKAKGMKTMLFTGEKGASKRQAADVVLVVPSAITAHVQEAHMVALHALATLVEARFFDK